MTRNRILNLMFIGTGLVVAAVLIFVFLTKKPALPAVVLSEPSMPSVGWDFLEKPLKVAVPDINIDLQTPDSPVFVSSSVSFSIKELGPAKGPFIFKVDCQNDGVFDFVGEPTSSKEVFLPLVCVFPEPGVFRALAEVEAVLNFYDQSGVLRQEKKIAQKTMSLTVLAGEPPWQIVSCDVDFEEGTTQSDFVFSFQTEISGDEQGLNFLWDFGDGATSNEKNPKHNYQKPGFYVPRLAVWDKQEAKELCVPKIFQTLGNFTAYQTEELFLPGEVGRQNPFESYTKEAYNNVNPVRSEVPSKEKATTSTGTVLTPATTTVPTSSGRGR
ncbi:MAG: PKD domain-containing protein [Patescibacteria group bacterium]|nr:PKD domain-containing protein [Patescibacteria group bacterium]